MISQKILGFTGLLMLTTSLIATTPHPVFAQTAPAIAKTTTHIEWQKPTRQLIQEGGLYGRVARVDAQNVACIYERTGGVHLKISADNGKTWGEEIGVAKYEHGNAANPELLILPDGDWLCSFNQRPRNEPGQEAQPFAIATCRSTDKGKTWSAPDVIYRAGTTGGVGCWEPRAILGEDNRVEMFFANEAPYKTTHEQEITRMISTDNGHSWGEAHRVNFRKNKRDGMPVPVVLQNGKMVMAIEDDGINGAFKPVIIEVPNDETQFVSGDSEQRWSALTEPLPAAAYAGAPYLCQMPNSTTILSAQLSPDGNDRKARMAVWVGDSSARNFTNMSLPFGEENQSSGLWNSIWPKDAKTVNALSSTTVDGVFGLWSIDGRVKAE